MDKVAGSKNDEFYTPKYAVLPILKYIEEKSRIWCPFDTEQSNFVKLLRQDGHEVYCSHIEKEDFFDLKYVGNVEYIISNPPYSIKTEILETLFKTGIPFAMLVGVVGLFESQRRFEMFRDNEFEVMYLNRRVSYFKDFKDEKPSLNPPFSSVYICKNMLPEKIIFEEIKK